MRLKKKTKLQVAKLKFNLAIFRLYDFVLSKLERHKKKATYGLTSLLFFSLANIALGATSYFIIQNGSNGDSGNTLLIGQAYTNGSFNNIAGFEVLPVAGAGAGNPITLTLCKGTSTNLATDWNCSGTSTSFIASTTFTATNNNVSIVTFTLPKYAEYSANYYFSLKTANNIRWAWLTTNGYTGGNVLPTTYGVNTDLYFRAFYNTSYDPAYLTITAPTNGQRYNDGIGVTLSGSIYNPNLAYNAGIIKVLDKQTYTATNDIYFEFATTSATFSELIDTSFFTSGNGNYRIYGYLIDINTGIKSTTSQPINIVLGTDTIYRADDAQYIKGGELSESQICGSIATSTFFGGVECAGRKLLYYSFTPNEFAKEKLTSSINTFKGQFPFTVYFQLTDSVTNTIASTTLTRNDTIDVIMIGKDKQLTKIPVLSSSSMPNLIGESNTNLIRNTIGWFIWLGVAFLVFLTFKKL